MLLMQKKKLPGGGLPLSKPNLVDSNSGYVNVSKTRRHLLHLRHLRRISEPNKTVERVTWKHG
jgi:hypothetical protein